MKREYQPKTGQRCSCRRGIERDNCPQCEATGWVIDFARIRASSTLARRDHDRAKIAATEDEP